MLMSENSLCSTFLPRPTQVVVVDPLALAITMIMQELGMQLKHASERSPQPVTFKFTHSAVQTISISPLLYVRPLHFRSHNSSSVPTLVNITTERECCVLKELWANGWLLVGRSLPNGGIHVGAELIRIFMSWRKLHQVSRSIVIPFPGSATSDIEYPKCTWVWDRTSWSKEKPVPSVAHLVVIIETFLRHFTVTLGTL